MDQLPFILLGPVLGQCPVDFFDLPVFYLFIHSDQRLPGLGEKNGSAYRTVDPVDHSEKDIARLLVSDLQVGLDLLLKSRIARWIGLDELSGLLVDDEQVVIFV